MTTVLRFPLLSDKTGRIARDYGVLLEDEGVALCGSDWKPGQMMAG